MDWNRECELAKGYMSEYDRGYIDGVKETAENLLNELYHIARFYYGNNANVLAWAKDKATKLGVTIKE